MPKTKGTGDSGKKKRKHSGAAADDERAPPQHQVRFQVEERSAKRRFVVPDGFAPVRERCIVNPVDTDAGRQELWIIQLPNLKAMQALAAVGSVDVDMRNGDAAVACFQDRDGVSYRLLPEAADVAQQLVAVCPGNDDTGAAQAAPITRRLTLVRATDQALTGATAGEAEDEAAALARLDASLEVMEAARIESEAVAAAEGGWALPAAAAGGSGGAGLGAGTPLAKEDANAQMLAPKSKGKQKEKGKEKSKHKEKAADTRTPAAMAAPAPAPAAAGVELNKKKDKDKSGKRKTPAVTPEAPAAAAAATPGTGVTPAARAVTAPPPAVAHLDAQPPGSAPANGGTSGKHKDKEKKDKEKKEKKEKKKEKKEKSEKKKEKKEKKSKKEKKDSSSSGFDSDADRV